MTAEPQVMGTATSRAGAPAVRGQRVVGLHVQLSETPVWSAACAAARRTHRVGAAGGRAHRNADRGNLEAAGAVRKAEKPGGAA